MGGGGGKGKRTLPPFPGQEVCLNIYDLSADLSLANTVAMDVLQVGGAFHAGVEVNGREWSFGLDGVSEETPRWHEYHVYRETIHMGRTTLAPKDVVLVIGEMMALWRGATYDLFRRNCCNFCNELCCRLGVGPIPGWVHRLALAGGDILNALEKAAGLLGMESPGRKLRKPLMRMDSEEDDDAYNFHLDKAAWEEIPEEVVLEVAAAWAKKERRLQAGRWPGVKQPPPSSGPLRNIRQMHELPPAVQQRSADSQRTLVNPAASDSFVLDSTQRASLTEREGPGGRAAQRHREFLSNLITSEIMRQQQQPAVPKKMFSSGCFASDFDRVGSFEKVQEQQRAHPLGPKTTSFVASYTCFDHTTPRRTATCTADAVPAAGCRSWSTANRSGGLACRQQLCRA